MTADRGRAAVYAAEIAAFDGTAHESRITMAEAQQLGRNTTSASWWPHGAVEVRAARADARSSSTRQRGSDAPVIRLAAPQLTPATVVHELAHVLAGIGAGHGPVFRRAHLDVALAALGADAATWLADAYRAMGLTVGQPAWPPPPPLSGTGPIAL